MARRLALFNFALLQTGPSRVVASLAALASHIFWKDPTEERERYMASDKQEPMSSLNRS